MYYVIPSCDENTAAMQGKKNVMGTENDIYSHEKQDTLYLSSHTPFKQTALFSILKQQLNDRHEDKNRINEQKNTTKHGLTMT